VKPGKLGIFGRRGKEALALGVGPFLVHQLVDRMARGAPRAPRQPGGDCQPEDRIGEVKAEQLVEQQRKDHRQIEQQVRLVMDMIRTDRDRPGLANHEALIGEQANGRGHRHQRHADAEFEPLSHLAALQPPDRAPPNAERRHRDQDHLRQRGERFGLAMAEAMVGIGRSRGETHPEKGHQAGDQIERGVGQAAEHRHRSRSPRRPALQADEEQRHRHARQRGAAGQRGAAQVMRMVVALLGVMAMIMPAAHG